MAFHIGKVLLILFGTVQFSKASATFYNADFNKTFHGDATYYGHTSYGNCGMRDRLPSDYADRIPVAINSAQYGNSETCGACIEILEGGAGSGHTPVDTSKGKIHAYVHDKCPECKHGDLDLSKNGDGRWAITWKFVPCPLGKELQVLFEGSNAYYQKIQLRGLRSPTVTVKLDGIVGQRTQDNFFEFHRGSPLPSFPILRANTVLGKHITAKLNGFKSHGLMIATDVNIY